MQSLLLVVVQHTSVQGVIVGPFACGSSTDGVRCANRDTRHGFKIAVESVQVY